MKLNYFIPVAMFVVSLTSCVSKVDSGGDPERKQEEAQVISNMISTTEYKVPITNGFTTKVMYKGALLASTSKPMTILIPKTAKTKASSDLQVYYQEGTALASTSTLWQTVLFEDTKTGDHDYNDIVFQTRYVTTEGNLKVSVHPVALGSTKDIKLGFRWTQGTNSGDVIVAESCRKNLFNKDDAGFINTRQYDVHYNEFAVEKDVKIGALTEAVNVWWYIIVDNGIVVNCVNPLGYECVDKNLVPYGFTISDAVLGPKPVSKAITKAIPDETEWKKSIVPTYDWAKMDAKAPAIPANAVPMVKDNYTALTVNHIAKGEAYSDSFNGGKNSTLYVSGTLNLQSSGTYMDWDSQGTTIYVMPGGVLNIKESDKVITPKINIVNYGTINAPNLFLQDNVLKSKGNINVAGMVNLNLRSKTYIEGNFKANELLVNGEKSNGGPSYLYVGGDLDIATKAHVTNIAELCVMGSVIINELNVTSDTKTYIGCKLAARTKAYITDQAVVSVKGHFQTPLIATTSAAKVNVMNGGLIECDKLDIQNTVSPSTSINVIGGQFGVLAASEISVKGMDMSRTFTGNMYVDFDQLIINGVATGLADTKIKLPGENIKFNDPNAKLDKYECSPGYNGGGGAEVLARFAYPKENVNINTCYNYDEWWKENKFDITPKAGAQLFDIEDTNPAKGEKKNVYDMSAK